MAAADATRSARCRKVRQLLFPARLQRSHQALLTPGDWAGKAGLLRQMTDWLTSSRLHVLSRSADPLTTRPSSHLEALSWEICPAYLSSTLTPITSPAAAHSYAVSSLVYRTVRPRADWCGDGGKGCHVARSGHIDQPPSEQGPRRVASRPAATSVRCLADRRGWRLAGTWNIIWEPPETQITTLIRRGVRNEATATSELS